MHPQEPPSLPPVAEVVTPVSTERDLPLSAGAADALPSLPFFAEGEKGQDAGVVPVPEMPMAPPLLDTPPSRGAEEPLPPAPAPRAGEMPQEFEWRVEPEPLDPTTDVGLDFFEEPAKPADTAAAAAGAVSASAARASALAAEANLLERVPAPSADPAAPSEFSVKTDRSTDSDFTFDWQFLSSPAPSTPGTPSLATPVSPTTHTLAVPSATSPLPELLNEPEVLQAAAPAEGVRMDVPVAPFTQLPPECAVANTVPASSPVSASPGISDAAAEQIVDRVVRRLIDRVLEHLRPELVAEVKRLMQ